MSSITFGGLATGLDTNSIVKELMALERKPIERLQKDKAYLNSRVKAFSEFEGKLKGLLKAMEEMDTSRELRSYSATSGSEEYFSVSASGNAAPGSYQIEVRHLAQLQKDVSNGYADPSETSFTAGTVTINGTDIAIEEGDSLADIVDKINAANEGDNGTGINAALINDGSQEGYRIVLTGKDAATTFTASANGVAGDGIDLAFSNAQPAQQANIVVDGIDIVSDNNTITNAIPGVTLTLLKENETGESTPFGVEIDQEGISKKIDAFVSAYNDIVRFVDEQSDTSWGRDSGLQSTKRRLQNMLVTTIGGSGDYHNLVDLGFKTNKDDGTVSIEGSKLQEAIADNLDSVEKLFLGEDGVEGITQRFKTYLEGITDSRQGIYASRKASTDSNIRRIESNIETMEMRLEQREKTLRMKFKAMEELVSSLNATGSYVSQQMSMISSMSSKK